MRAQNVEQNQEPKQNAYGDGTNTHGDKIETHGDETTK